MQQNRKIQRELPQLALRFDPPRPLAARGFTEAHGARL